jgi:hypothetical protein
MSGGGSANRRVSVGLMNLGAKINLAALSPNAVRPPIPRSAAATPATPAAGDGDAAGGDEFATPGSAKSKVSFSSTNENGEFNHVRKLFDIVVVVVVVVVVFVWFQFIVILLLVLSLLCPFWNLITVEYESASSPLIPEEDLYRLLSPVQHVGLSERLGQRSDSPCITNVRL